MDRIERAEAFATDAHKGQLRPYTGAPYIGHPARVVGLLEQYLPTAGADMICAAWLHDVIEDTTASPDEIRDWFGFSTLSLVWELTKPNEPTCRQAMVIKACDLLDNVGTIADHAPRDKAQAYLRKKAPQVLRICERLAPYYPALAERLGQAYLENAKRVFIKTL